MNNILLCVAGRPSGGRGRGRGRPFLGVALAVGVMVALVACKDTAVPNYPSPQINALSPSGIQFRVLGVVSGQREDMFPYVVALNSFARDAGNWTTTDSRYITEWQGAGIPIPNSDYYGTVVWDVEFRNARDAQLILDDLPKVTPAYSASDLAAVTGIVQTFKAYNFMLVAETRDTLGVPIYGIVANPTTPAPILCTKDTWAAIVAMLDSGNAALNAANPANPLPIQLPAGFNNVNAAAGPSTTAGTFAAFNRALAAKAGVELAFAIARSPGGTPPDTLTAGAPSVAALTRADSAATASALFPASPAQLFVETTPGSYIDPSGVYHSFSGASGDIANPLQGGLPTLFVYDSLYEVLSAAGGSPGRFGKLIQQSASNAPPFPTFNFAVTVTIAAQPTFWTSAKYPSPGSPIPIIRGEDLVLFDAVAQLGMGNTANALALIKEVHTAAGEPFFSPPPTYIAVRNQLLEEFRMSNFLEGGDRAIMIRGYGMETVTDNTWGALASGDTHATVIPIPTGEASARGGNTAYTCS